MTTTLETWGAFHSTQNSLRKFRLVHQMERTISVWSDRNIRDQLWRWSTLTGLVISVGRSDRNVPFHLTKLLSPVPLFCIPLTRTITKPVACENSRTEHVEFPTFQTGIFVEWKAPSDMKYLYQDWFDKSWMKICWRRLVNNLLERSCN